MTAPLDMGLGYNNYQYHVKRQQIEDRQCPNGRIYTGNTRYVHFFYDPAVMFKWSEKRTWPDQLLDIRILSLRLAFVFRSRMFLGVTDGWVA